MALRRGAPRRFHDSRLPVLYTVTMGGDPFETLVSAHHSEIYRFLRRVTGERDVAEDLCQETFLRAFRAYRRDVEGNPRAWLFVIASNLARNHARRERRAVRAKEALAARIADCTSDEGPVRSEELREDLRRAVRELPPKQRLAFTLRKFHDSDYALIASCLKCSRESARANVFQALKTLRHRLNGAMRKGLL